VRPSNRKYRGGLQKSGAQQFGVQTVTHKIGKVMVKSYYGNHAYSADISLCLAQPSLVPDETRFVLLDVRFIVVDVEMIRIMAGRWWPRLQHFLGRNSIFRGAPPPANFEPCRFVIGVGHCSQRPLSHQEHSPSMMIFMSSFHNNLFPDCNYSSIIANLVE